MSTTDQPAPSASLNIDPRLHQMQDSNERPTNGDDQTKAALNHVYQREREQHNQEYPPDVEALLKQLPPNALPPNLTGAARDGPSSYNMYPVDPDAQQDPHTGHPRSHSEDAVEEQLNDGDPSGTFQMSQESEAGTTRDGRKKRTDGAPEDWTRIRKNNHKEVERRRRGAIDAGINELSALMPTGGSSDKAKSAILSRAVTYIRQLKENEACNIEKWTLEKLLMDQAMGELRATIDETRRRWDEEHTKVQTLEAEVADLRGQLARGGSSGKRPRTD